MRFALIILLGAFMPLVVYSQVHIVDNNQNAPGGANHYGTLAAAITAASAGDTIFVVPSNTSYGTLDFGKQLIIIGGGFFPAGNNKQVSQVDAINIRSSATSGSTISSLYVSGETRINSSADVGNIENLTIQNNYLDKRISSYNRNEDTLNILTIQGNIIGYGEGASHSIDIPNPVENVEIKNNVLLGNYGAINILNTSFGKAVNIQHNIFLGNGKYAFARLDDATINNNIFYGRSPESLDSAFFLNNTISNNISFGTLNDFGTAGNKLFNVRNVDGGGNLTIDPQFVNVSLTNSWSMLYDLHVQATEATTPIPHIGIYTGLSNSDFTNHGSILPYVHAYEGVSEIVIGNNLQLEVTTNSGSGSLSVQKIEYFIDGTDPGIGQAIDAGILGPLSSPSTNSITYNTSSLLEGFHTIFTRVQNDLGTWGNYEPHLIYVNNAEAASAVDIVAMEYFIDSDPGYGNGTVVPGISPSGEVEAGTLIETDTLSIGFHTLYIRAQDSNGKWGISESRLIYVDKASGTLMPDITKLEYFFDEDPGYNSAVPITITADSVIDITEIILTDALTPGFHTFYLRAMDSNNKWGILESRLIFVEDPSVSILPDITGIEYFFDEDPGYGQGIAMSVSTDSVVDIMEVITTDSLTLGFHSLFVRAQSDSGDWGIPESRLVYIDQTGSAVVPDITKMEYFFDSDPGYGAGTELIVSTPASIVDITESISTESLTPGFHTLFIRVQNAEGQWGILESRLIYVDEANISSAPLAAIEYFVDLDPGYGNATQIPVSASENINLKWNVGSIPQGDHLLGVRVKNSDNIWSITEMFKFHVYDESRVLDSAALVEIYEKNNGPSWTSQTNWISSNNIDTWFGVTIDTLTGRVIGLNLNGNNLSGKLAKEFGYLLDIENVDLSNNSLSDTIHSSATNLVNLQTLNVAKNDLNGIPNLSVLASLNTLNLDSNAFEFGDIEPLTGIENLTYSGQDKLLQGYDSAVNTGQAINISVNTTGFNNQYQWFLNGNLINGANDATYSIASLGINDVGDYHVEITNSVATTAVMFSDLYRLFFDGPTADSLALVAIYDSLNGDSWIINTNWKTAPVSQWYGITTDTLNRVSSIHLPSNNLSGELPDNIKDLKMLDSLIVGGNNISGSLTSGFLEMESLKFADLSNNSIDNIPDNIKTSLPSLSTLKIEGNKLQFGSLETNLAISNFSYVPQDSVLAPGELTTVIGGKAAFYVYVSGANNMYQWYKDGVAINGENLDSLLINNVEFPNAGLYQVKITNTLIPDLTLFSQNTKLIILGLEADIQALSEFYTTNGGDDWINNTGWLADTITNWHGVVVNNGRVTEVNLPSNNISGDLSQSIVNLTALERLDLSDNELTGLPDLSGLSALTFLDVSSNKLLFDPIKPNVEITGIIYSPQDSIGSRSIDTVSVHSQQILYSPSLETGNTYKWLLNGSPMEGATSDSLVLNDFSAMDIGTYNVQVSNDQVPDLVLTSRLQTFLASATISGIVDDDESKVITEGGRVILLRISEIGGYDTTAVVPINNDGTYKIENVILDDYQLIAESDSNSYSNHLPTYYIKSIFWEEADTLSVVDNIDNLDITLTVFNDLSLDGEGEIFGYVEEEIADEGGRMSARRRVASAGVSVRRVKRAGRKKLIERSRILETSELVGFFKTNEDGEFTFERLADDVYYFNVQYPGYPMDSTSFIEMPLGTAAGGSSSYLKIIEVEALIDNNKIVVKKLNVTAVFVDQKFSQIKIYPNPAEEYVTIDLSEYPDTFSIMLFDELGRLVWQELKASNKIELDVQRFPSGIYILKILDQDEQPVNTQRMIIK